MIRHGTSTSSTRSPSIRVRTVQPHAQVGCAKRMRSPSEDIRHMATPFIEVRSGAFIPSSSSSEPTRGRDGPRGFVNPLNLEPMFVSSTSLQGPFVQEGQRVFNVAQEQNTSSSTGGNNYTSFTEGDRQSSSERSRSTHGIQQRWHGAIEEAKERERESVKGSSHRFVNCKMN